MAARRALAALCALWVACSLRVAAAENRTYYIQAEEVEWDYVPLGNENCKLPGQQNFTGDTALYATAGIGSVWKKGQYVEYTDATFQTRVERPAEQAHFGLLGPLLRGTVGDNITVVFRNAMPSFNTSIRPMGLKELTADGEEDNQGASFSQSVAPNTTHTYTWIVPASAAPAEGEPALKLWLYSPGASLPELQNTGLMGAILIANDSAAHSDGVRDIVTVWTIFKEQESYLWDDNLAGRTAEDLGLADDAELEQTTLRHTVNGYMYCNIPGLELEQGQTARWHVGSFGSEDGMHGVHWHGATFEHLGRRSDSVKLMPGTAVTLTFEPDTPGTWLLHCHVNSHLAAGMNALYTVTPSSDNAAAPALALADAAMAPAPSSEGSGSSQGTVRTYYIAAEAVEWDYTPLGGDACPVPEPVVAGSSGDEAPQVKASSIDTTATSSSSSSSTTNSSSAVREWTPEQAALAAPNAEAGLLGGKLIKARFIEYTDATFMTKKERPSEEAYLGLLGPIMRAEVGDTIRVVFRNRLGYPTSVHPHGVQYAKASEGSPYNDGLGVQEGDAVPPNETFIYNWTVPERAGPGPADPSTIVWMYHSHANEIKDTIAGLVGAIVVGRKGAFRPGTSYTAKDVDREVVLFFSVLNELDSLMWPDNAALAGVDEGLEGENSTMLVEAAGGEAAFQAAYQKHSINGYMFCNQPQLTFQQGERVRFHVISLGTDVDIHSPSMSSAVFVDSGRSAPALVMMPGVMQTSDAVMGIPGRSVLQCKVAEHVEGGMITSYLVTPSSSASSAVSSTANTTAAASANSRLYIQAEDHIWSYAPVGYDACSNFKWNDGQLVFTGSTNVSIGSAYHKAFYRRYLDESFSQEAPLNKQHGLLGPLLTLEVGQSFELSFRNALAFPVNLVFEGGLIVEPGSADPAAPVEPGATAIYRYTVPATMGPSAEDLSTVAYAYTSSVDPAAHANAGLVGILVVGAPGAFGGSSGAPALVDSVPTGVSQLIPLLFTVGNENRSPYLQRNVEAMGVNYTATQVDEDAMGAFEESNLMHGINGYVWCNMPPVEATVGQRLRFVILGMGGQTDMHAPIFVGQVLQYAGNSMETTELLPTVTRVMDVLTSQPGTWEFYCDVHDHYEAGMRAHLVVTGATQASLDSVANATVTTASSAAGPAAAAPSWLRLAVTALLAAALAMALAA